MAATPAVDRLDELIDLAQAIGLVRQGALNPGWFTDPGANVGGMLRNPEQRDALLRAIDTLLGDDAEAFLDEAGRTWVPVVTRGGMALHVVVEAVKDVTRIAIGVRLDTVTPLSRTDVLVPLMLVPAEGAASAIPGTGDGRVRVVSEITLGGAAPPPGEPGLEGVGFAVDVAADGTTPKLSVHLRGVRLSGQDAPQDLDLDGSGTAAQLGDEGMRLVLGLIERSVAGASGPLADLLALVGVGAGADVPPLPVADVLARGVAAWRDWLAAVAASPAAVGAWLQRAAGLAGHGATVTTPAGPEAPRQLTWAVLPGVPLSFSVRVTTTPSGARAVELGAQVRASSAGPPPGGIELDAVLVRFTLGAAPSVAALPAVSLLARLGDQAGPALVEGQSVRVQLLRAGFSLNAARQPVLALAAHNVKIGAAGYPVLDLTNLQTLADLGAGALGQAVTKILTALGPAGPAVGLLLGLAAPAGRPWPIALTPLPDLLSDPVRATMAYHARVLRATGADAPGRPPPAYTEMVSALGSLLAQPGQPATVAGQGTGEDPWRAPLATGVTLTVVRDGGVTLGLAVERAVADVGGGCPTLRLEARAQLARIALGGAGSQVLPAASARLLVGARDGVALRIGPERAPLLAQQIGLELGWRSGAPLRLRLATSGLEVEIQGERVPFSLPTLAADGTLEPDVPWRALELLTAHVVAAGGSPGARRLVELLGWRPQPGGRGAGERTPLESLVTDPLGALRELALDVDLDDLARWTALLFAGSARPGVDAGTTIGHGDRSSPHRIPVVAGGEAAARSAALLLWAGTGREVPEEPFRPQTLIGALTEPADGAAPPGAEELAAAVGVAALFGPTAEDAFEARPQLAAGFAALAARWAGSDGLVPGTSAAIAHATVHDFDDVGHLDLPAALDLQTVTGVAPGPAVVYVTGPLGPAAWPGVAADHVLDLTAPGLPPEGFDVGAAFVADGPWAVRLPSRADAVTGAPTGFAGQVARLGRVVDAVLTHAAGAGPVMLVAHGAAGHAALAVAASRPGITHLVTVGTPHGPVDLGVLDAQPAAGALQLLDALLPAPDEERPEHDAVVVGRGLVSALMAAYRAPAPQDDLAAPATLAALPAGTAVHCVRGVVKPAALGRALAGLVVRALQEAYEADAQPGDDEPEAGIGAGLLVRLAAPAAPGSVRVRTELSLLAPAVTVAGDPGGARGIRARVDIDRENGWLAGGPGGAPRAPSVRRVTLELELPAGAATPASARIVLHEAEGLGVRRRRWILGGGGEPVPPEARAVLGRFAAALGPLPASGPTRQLVDVLTALGLTEPGTSAGTGAPVALSVDGVARLLADPAGLAREAPPAPLAQAVARLVGAPAPAPDAPATWVAEVDGLRITADHAIRRVHVETIGDGLALAAGLRLRGHVALDGDGTLVGAGSLAALAGAVVLDGETAPAGLRLRLDGGAAVPSEVALHPVPDVAGLARLLVAVAPAEVVAAGVAALRDAPPAGVRAAVDPLLAALGLLGADGRVSVPVGLLSDPAGRLTRPLAGGDRVAALADAVGALVGIRGSGSGTWSLPYGLGLAAGAAGSRWRVALALPQPAGGGLRITGTAGITGAPGSPVTPELDAAIAAPGDGTGHIALRVAGTDVSARLVAPSLGLDVQLVPAGAGLAGSVVSGVVHALPVALDALSAHATLGKPLGDLGDALGLRPTGSFDADQLAALAADPARGLGARMAANLSPALDALRALLAPAVPPSLLTLEREGSELVLRRKDQSWLALRLGVPSAAGVRITGSVTGLHPFAGATVAADATLDAAGLARLVLGLTVDPASATRLGPLRLAPRVDVAVGPGAPKGPRVAAGLVLKASTAVLGVLRLGQPRSFAVELDGPGTLADALTALLVPIAVDLALATSEVKALLARPAVGTTTLKTLLQGVLLTGEDLDPQALDPAHAFTRLLKLGANVAAANPSLPVGPLSLGVARSGDLVGLRATLPPGGRLDLVSGDVTVQAEVDASWVTGTGDPGLTLHLLSTKGGGGPAFGLGLRGLGLRLARRQGPLLDAFLVADSVALHGLVEASAAGVTAGGGQLELTGLRVPVGSSTGSSDKVASGVLRDSASGSERLAPRFSPAFSVQRHGTGALQFDLRAGPGDGPWYIPIQRAFGPAYIEQVGFGVSRSADGLSLTGARVVVDGQVTLLGLTVAVDDLGIGATWPANAGGEPLYSSKAWSVAMAGLAVAAQTGGLSIAGGLRRRPDGLPDYVGMFSLRFGPYALTAFGGYGIIDGGPQGDFTSLFIFGALNAPIGGPPAFFLTGIGGGVGINRRLKLPPDLDAMADFPLLAALDDNSPIAQSPQAAMDALSQSFPPERGAFWFAAGLSFTSFALVDCVAVVGVEIADGLTLTLMGLARAALPSTELPLVGLELALLVRFSTRDGVLWMQGQLTDNSYLLTKDVRLTGGFAYVTWFKGDKAGEFVLTLGGYHPSFHRDGYPVVPRLGFVWAIGKALVIKGESYFALTSEAIMLGTRFEARLTLGPLWAYLRLGADGIVFFDPFRFEVSAFAELGAGITIDIDLGWFGHIRITIAFHLHADVVLIGPNFHGRATIDLGVASATIRFGDTNAPEPLPLDWRAFSDKYLRPGGKPVISAVPGRGQVPPAPGGTDRPQTGASDDPYLVKAEFELLVTSTAPYSHTLFSGDQAPHPGAGEPLAIGPMQVASLRSVFAGALFQDNVAGDQISRMNRSQLLSQLPKGVWGPQGDDKPIPKGQTIRSGTGLRFSTTTTPTAGLVPIAYDQVEVGARHPLPFLTEGAPHVQAPPAPAEPAPPAIDTRPGRPAVAAVLTVAGQARAELRRGPGLQPRAAARLGARADALAWQGTEVAPGEVLLLQMPNGARDVGARRPALQVDGAARVVVLDTVGGVALDATLDGGEVELPPKTARIAVIGGGAPDGAAGWNGDTALVQLGARSLAGPGCTVTTSTLSTRRGIVAVTAAIVTAAAAVGGRSLVTTRLPATTRAVAIKLAADPRATGEAALRELGLEHARTAGPPRGLDDGTSVYAVAVDDGAPAVAITVASGRDADLCGVLGSPLEAAELARRLGERGFQGMLGGVAGAARDTARVRWRGVTDAEAA